VLVLRPDWQPSPPTPTQDKMRRQCRLTYCDRQGRKTACLPLFERRFAGPDTEGPHEERDGSEAGDCDADDWKHIVSHLVGILPTREGLGKKWTEPK